MKRIGSGTRRQRFGVAALVLLFAMLAARAVPASASPISAAGGSSSRFGLASGQVRVLASAPANTASVSAGASVAQAAAAGLSAITDPCTLHWTALDGNFNYPGNWTPNAVPGPGMHVCIDAPGSYTVRLVKETVVDNTTNPPTTIVYPSQANVGYLDIKANNGTPTLIIKATAQTTAGIVVNHDLYNSGQIILSTQNCSGGNWCGADTLDTLGTFTNDTGGIVSTQGDSTSSNYNDRSITGQLINFGQFSIVQNATFSGTFDNSGDFEDNSSAVNNGGWIFRQRAGKLSAPSATYLFSITGGGFEYYGGTIDPLVPVLTNIDLTLSPTLTNVTHDGILALRGTNTLHADVPAHLTLDLQARPQAETSLTSATSFTNLGAIVLETMGCSGGNWCGDTKLAVSSGTLTNSGMITAGGDTTSSNYNTRRIAGNFVNTGTLNVNAAVHLDFSGISGSNTTVTNRGTIAIVQGGLLSINGADKTLVLGATSVITGGDGLTLSDGNVTLDGTLSRTATLTHEALTFPAGTAFNGAAYLLGTNTLAGDVPAAVTLDLQARPQAETSLTSATSFTNLGAIVLETTGCSGGNWCGDTKLAVSSGTLTNSGMITAGGDTTSSNYNTRRIAGNFVNTGTLNVNAAVHLDFSGISGSNTTVTNRGTIAIVQGGLLSINGADKTLVLGATSVITGGDGLTLSDGNVTLDGTLSRTATLTHEALTFPAGTAFNGAAYLLGTNTLAGDVPAAVTLDLQARPQAETSLTSATSFTNLGAIVLETTGCSGGNWCGDTKLAVSSGTLTNSGMITAGGDTTSSNYNTRRIAGNFVNTGRLTIKAPFAQSGGTFSQSASGHLATTISGTTAGSGYGQAQISGAATLGGALDITFGAGYTPHSGDVYTLLTYGSASGSFASVTGIAPANGLSFTPNQGTASYTLTVTAPPTAPTVTNLSPVAGPESGHTTIAITGTNFSTALHGTSFTFGATAALFGECASSTVCHAISPPGTGTVDVTATVAGATSTTSANDRFQYVPQPTVTGITPQNGPAAGGTQVTITGTNFDATAGATSVQFGTTAASGVSCSSTTSCMATSPAGSGSIDVTVSSTGGTSATSAADQFTYTAACQNPAKADITSPTGGSLTTGTPTFTWGGGACITQYYFYVGSSAGQNDLFSAGPLPATSTSATVSPAIPVDGRTVYVRLWSLVNGGFQAADHSYLMGACQNGTKADITSPSGGSITTGTPTFQWGGGACITQYYFYVGSSAGQNDLFSAGPLPSTSTSATVSPAIPVDGRTIYVRLWSQVNGNFQAVDHSYLMGACQNPAKADITAPTGGSITTGTPTFTWGGGSCVTQYYLYVGNSSGQNDLYSAGPLASTTTSATISPAIPVDGRTIYVRLWSLVNGGYQAVDHSYLMGACANPAKADITSPSGGTVSSGTPTFQWGGGACVTQYYFYVGSSFGQNDLYSAGPLAGTVTQATVSPAIPVDGRTIYVRLWSLVNGQYQAVDHSYLMGACANPSKADISSPVGSTLHGASQTFTWSGGACVTQYYLYIGSSFGQADLYSSGPLAGTVTAQAVTLPASGSTVYVRLWSLVNGQYQAVDHSYVSAP